jgi:SAM-dependent methyltransferase
MPKRKEVRLAPGTADKYHSAPMRGRSLDEDSFYPDTLRHLMHEGVLSSDMRLLVACAGKYDRDVLYELGFKNVTISNLDVRLKGDEFEPFNWSYQDVEHLTFEDAAFDFAIVHNGLHHCFSPHRGLLELYRVAKRGVLAFEPRDTLLVRLGIRLNFGQQYEVAAVSHHGLEYGGVGNTGIPNFIYRWTEEEFEKTITCYAPFGKHRFIYQYAMRINWSRLSSMRNRLFAMAVRLGMPVFKLVFTVFPKQANGFAFAVEKPRIPAELHPWLQLQNGEIAVNDAWIEARYRVAR